MSLPSQLQGLSALVFDFIGTTTDWFTPVTTALKAHAAKFPALTSHDWDAFAHEWRAAFFAYVADLASKSKEIPLIEIFRATLLPLLQSHRITDWDESVQNDLVKSWAMQEAWEDTAIGLDALRQKFITAVLSNGSTRTIIDANKRENMNFDLILSSDIMGQYKPNPKTYQTARSTLRCEPHQVAMVASHAFDLDAAATHGFKTIYISRHTEDRHLDQTAFGNKYDLVINEGGLVELARRLGAL